MKVFMLISMLGFLSIASAIATPQFPPLMQGENEYKTGGYTLRLMAKDTMGVMWEGQRMVGSIYTANGQLLFLPSVPEPDASKAKKAFDEWKGSGKKTDAPAPPPQPIIFEADGGAVVPLPDGSVVHFAPTYAEITQPNSLATVPGQAAVHNFKVELASPSMGKMLFKSSSGISVNGTEVKPMKDGAYAGGRKSMKLNAYYKPIVEGPMTTAAQLAAADAKKPANALDYVAEVKRVGKRVDESF